MPAQCSNLFSSSLLDESSILDQWNRLKFSLQDPTNWTVIHGDDIHLTCLPTLFGFSGRNQLVSGFSSSPNFLSSNLLSRFNNKSHSISCAVQKCQDGTIKIIELLYLTLLHYEQFPWLLLKGQASRSELSFTMTISATCVIEEGIIKLKEVFLNWDQASVLVQSGILLEGIKQAVRKSISPEDYIEGLKIDPKKIKSRLEYPNPNNITSPTLPTKEDNTGNKEEFHVRRNPMTEKTELTMEDPNNVKQQPIRKHPAMTSDYFSSPEQPRGLDRPAKLHPAISSKINLGTEFTPLQSTQKNRPPVKAKSVFFSDSPLPASKPSVVLDPKRLASNILAPEEDKPLVPTIPSLDENRFKSTWSESDMSEDSPMPARTMTKIIDPKRFESHIFSPLTGSEGKLEGKTKSSNSAVYSNNTLLGIVEKGQEIKRLNVRIDPNRFQSSINFNTADTSQPAVKPAIADNSNQNGIHLGTIDSPSVLVQQREHAKQALNSRTYSSQKSSIDFDFDNPQRSPPKATLTR